MIQKTDFSSIDQCMQLCMSQFVILHYATKNWSWFLPADFMIDSEYFFIAEPESAVQISDRACVRELFADFSAIFREM